MHDINLGAVIARERRAADVTQGELAAHLGVTKAAVSKWELGQSMPDVALLPRIAAYFDLTLDELFDYRPQLTKDEVRDVYLRLFAQMSEDPDAALESVDRLVAEYYSCWPLLQQMGGLYVQRAVFDTEHPDELCMRAIKLFERVEEHADDVELVRTARMMRASTMNILGDVDGCISLFESLKPERSIGVELLLAATYEQKGDREACLKLYQESMGWGVISVMSSLNAQLPLYADDAAHRDALVQAGEGMLRGFDLEAENPLSALTFLASASAAYLLADDEERTRAYLERFIALLGSLDARGLLYGARQGVLYDLVPELTASDPGQEQEKDAQVAALDPKQLGKQLITARPPWAEHADDPRFRPLLDRLEALR